VKGAVTEMEATAEGARSGMMTKRLPGISDSVRARERTGGRRKPH